MTQPEADKPIPEPAAEASQADSSGVVESASCLGGALTRRRRRWYQFSLWSLFALTLVAAMTLWGWREIIAPYRDLANTMKLVERLGGTYQSVSAPKWISRLAGWETGHLTLVNLADCDQPDDYMAAVARLPRLEILVVGGKAFSDEHVERLSRTKSLRWLILDSTGVSADALAAVQAANPDLSVYRSQRRTIAAIKAARGQLPLNLNADYLELQDLVGAEFFDEPAILIAYDRVKPPLVADLSSLEVANLWGPVRDADLSATSKSRSLRTLSFDSPWITNDGARHFARMPQLHTLALSWSQLTDVGLATLAEKRDWKGLYLGGTQIGDEGLAHLADLRDLEELHVERTKVTNAGLLHLRALPKLKVLELSATQVTDAGMPELGKHKELQSLYLSNTQVSDEALTHLAGMSNLRMLAVDSVPISDKGLSHLKDLKNLETLWMDGTKLTDAAVEHLAQLSNLRRLDMSGTQVTVAGVAKLQKSLPACRIGWQGVLSNKRVAAASATGDNGK